jgi:hypothetical protein
MLKDKDKGYMLVICIANLLHPLAVIEQLPQPSMMRCEALAIS